MGAVDGAGEGAAAGSAFGPYGAAIGAGVGLLGGVLGGKGGGGSQSSSTATNSLNLNFNPTIANGGTAAPYNTGSNSASPVVTQDPTQTNPIQGTGSSPFPSLFGTTPPGRYDVNGLPLAVSPSGATVAGQGVAANLSGNTIILIAGIGLLLVLAMTGGHKRR